MLSEHKMFPRCLLDIHNVQKTSEKHLMFFALSKHKMFLRCLLDVYNVQKTSFERLKDVLWSLGDDLKHGTFYKNKYVFFYKNTKQNQQAFERIKFKTFF